MNREILKSRLERLEPIFLSNDETGLLRVLEKSAGVLCDVAPDHLTDDQKLAGEIESLLSKYSGSNSILSPSVRCFIHLKHEATGLEGAADTLAALSKFLGSNGTSRIIIHSNQSVFDHAPLLSLARTLREQFSLSRGLGIQLVAPFGEYREAEMEALFNLGVTLKYAAGWISNGQDPTIDVNTLRSLSEFGFRVPIEWYVHENNMPEFSARIQNLLIANFSGGFSLPLVSQNPYYRFEPDFPKLPEALAYCQFLMQSYEEYPYFDDVFYPLNVLAMLIKDGGWNPGLNIPTAINFILDENGQIDVFRQSPALGKRFASMSEVVGTPLDELKARFLDFANQAWKWENIPYCRECRWRRICGGLDPDAGNHVNQDIPDTMCGHRKLFLEHFANLRAPDHVMA